MDTTVNQLNVLLRQGVISAQIYADGIDAIASRLERPTQLHDFGMRPLPRLQFLRKVGMMRPLRLHDVGTIPHKSGVEA